MQAVQWHKHYSVVMARILVLDEIVGFSSRSSNRMGRYCQSERIEVRETTESEQPIGTDSTVRIGQYSGMRDKTRGM